MRALLILVLSIGISAVSLGTADALTGAQLKGQTRAYAVGYLWGALNAHLFIGTIEGASQVQAHRMNCVQDAVLTDQAFADAVFAMIDRDASLLRLHSNSALIRTLIEMCD
jgi:hypothetical protein